MSNPWGSGRKGDPSICQPPERRNTGFTLPGVYHQISSKQCSPNGGMNLRLCEALQSVGEASCGELGTRLAERLAIQTSPTTILRRIMVLPTAAVERVSELGIEDFSFRRGRNFGTILVDMQSHQTIDLLPDRKKETAAAWMSAHPEIDEGSSGSRRRLCFCGSQWCSPSHPVCGQVPRVEKSWRSPGGVAGTSSGSVSDPPN